MGWVLGATQRPPKQIYFMVSGANVFIVLECLTKSWLCDMALAVVSYVHPLSTIQIQNALIYIVCLSHNVKYLIEE